MWPLRRIIKYSAIGGATIITGLSLQSNAYDINSLGIVRLSRAAITVYDIGITYKTKLYYKEWDKTSPEYKTERNAVHTLAAEKLLKLICINKGVYIKVGQHIGSLDYLLPPEYVKTMKILHSNAPKNSVEDVYKVIKQDLKVNPSDIFQSFDPEPLGTASLAQVHRAKLIDGREIAIKVQHPYVKGNSRVDMKTMEYLCKLMSWVFPDFKMQWLVDETKKNLPRELDFLNEGHNAEKLGKMFGSRYSWLKIPEIHWDLSTSRVLSMEFLEGGQVNDLDYIRKNKIDTFEVANKIGQLYSNMIFITGFVHSDPHPGNILVRKTKSGSVDIVLLDHGLYADLTDKFRYEYSKLWLSILKVDREGMRNHCLNLGVGKELYPLFACMLTGRPWNSVIGGIDRVKQSAKESKIMGYKYNPEDSGFPESLRQILASLNGYSNTYSPKDSTDLLTECLFKQKDELQSTTSILIPHISDVLEQVDRQMLLVLKTNDLIRSIENTLQTQNRMTSFWVMSRCCVKTVYNQDKHKSATKWEFFKISVQEKWSLFKLNVYYLLKGLSDFSLISAIRQIM